MQDQGQGQGQQEQMQQQQQMLQQQQQMQAQQQQLQAQQQQLQAQQQQQQQMQMQAQQQQQVQLEQMQDAQIGQQYMEAQAAKYLEQQAAKAAISQTNGTMMADDGSKHDPNVIEWENALEQCGGDEEFLLELLVDFWEEMSEKLTRIQEALAEPTIALNAIKSSAHAIKGASANLMCPKIQSTSFALEQGAKRPEITKEEVQIHFDALMVTFTAYHKMIIKLGLV